MTQNVKIQDKVYWEIARKAVDNEMKTSKYINEVIIPGISNSRNSEEPKLYEPESLWEPMTAEDAINELDTMVQQYIKNEETYQRKIKELQEKLGEETPNSILDNA